MQIYPYQEVGSRFLAQRKRALLADTMGLGKTAQAIKACDLVGARRILVICPASVRINWHREFARFSEYERRCNVKLDGRGGLGNTEEITILSYELATRANILNEIMRQKFDVLILDESHYLKSREAKRTTAIYGALCKGDAGIISRATHTWALTGTPTPNHPGEIFSILRAFGIWAKNYWAFESQFCTTVDNGYGPVITGMRNVDQLKELVKPIMIRRKIEEVMTDLPIVTFSDIVLTSHGITHPEDEKEWRDAEKKSEEGKKLKSRIEAAADDLSLDLDNLHMPTLRRLTGIAKVRPLYELIARELDSGLEKIVIGAIHRDVIEQLRQLFAPQYGCVTIYGGSDPTTKQKRIDEFVDKWKPRVLIGQVDAIAGIDGLQKVCNQGVFAECSWTPSNNNQLIGRLRRNGQTKPVFWRFASLANSMDEHVMRVNRKKIAMITQLLD